MRQLCPPTARDTRARVRLLSQRLSVHLENCSQIELLMLVRYYVDGEDEDRIAAASGTTRDEFAALRRRLRETVLADRQGTTIGK